MYDTLMYSKKTGYYGLFRSNTLWKYDSIGSVVMPIYRVRVTRTAPSLHGAFVDAGGEVGLLKWHSRRTPCTEGMVVLAGKMHDAEGEKKMTLSSYATIVGSYVVHKINRSDGVQFSKSFAPEILELVEAPMREKAQQLGGRWIIRSAVLPADLPDAFAEMERISSMLHGDTLGEVCPCSLFPTDVLGAKARQIISDDEEFLASLPSGKKVVYNESVGEILERAIAQAKECEGRKIALIDSAEMVWDKTEACTVVDVNAHGYRLKRREEEVAYEVNRLAISKVIREIVLRDIHGIVLVDLINVPKVTALQLFDYACEEATIERHIRVHDITALCILEITC